MSSNLKNLKSQKVKISSNSINKVQINNVQTKQKHSSKSLEKGNFKREFILESLDCANCASKIERRTNELEGVQSANLNFVMKKLTVYFETVENINEIVDKIKSIVKSLEPDVIVSEFKKKKMSDLNNIENEEKEQSILKENLSLFLGIVIFLISVFIKINPATNFILYLIAYIFTGKDVVIKAIKNIIKGEVFDENFLMAIATVGAFAIGEFSEAVAVMVFYQIGEFFQDLAVNKSRKSITSLMDIRPDYANLKVNNEVKKVSPDEVLIGDIILVKPGEKIPLDGIIIEGSAAMDTSALTGESVPREVTVNDEVLSGFINKNGVISIAVTKDFEESTASKILELVQNASSKKAEAEKFITKFAKYYTPIVVVIALLLAILPPIFTTITFYSSLYRALSFLVVSCPCALVISIPLSFFGGIGAASRKGILIKGGNYLEALNNVNTVVFDKTGTLTKGIFEVQNVIVANEKYNKDDILNFAAIGESYSNHPIAISIVKQYKKVFGIDIDNTRVSNYEEISGHGLKYNLENDLIIVGNDKLMTKENIEFNDVEEVGTIIHVALNNNYLGLIVIRDAIKEDTISGIKALKDLGIKNTVMLTGDNKKVANFIGKEINIDTIKSELLPSDKVSALEEIIKENNNSGKIIFVGDGINDAPVLARADIGIAMGGVGSDAAIEASDVVIMNDEISKIAEAINLGRRTRKIVIQNIVFALTVKILLLIGIAFGLATMWEAVFGDVGVALIAVLNAMRLSTKENK